MVIIKIINSKFKDNAEIEIKFSIQQLKEIACGELINQIAISDYCNK